MKYPNREHSTKKCLPPKQSRNIFIWWNICLSFILFWEKQIKHLSQVLLDCDADILMIANIMSSVPY